MAKVELTLEEIIATLEHSNLPAIVVEGKDDIIIYRKLEEEISNVVVTPVGGRANVLKIFQETINPNGRLYNKNIVFIADQDIWINIGIPDEFKNQKLIFTSGYSIENDVFIDYCCQKMIDDNPDIKSNFNQDKEKFIDWYALALQATIDKYNYDLNKLDCAENLTLSEFRKISHNPERVFKQYEDMIKLLENESPNHELKQSLIDDFPLSIRGKSLMALFTSNMKNGIRTMQIFQNIAVRPNDCINRIFDDVKILF